MKNATLFQRNNPLSIRIIGTGEYVKKECARLVDSFEQAEADHLEEIRQDHE